MTDKSTESKEPFSRTNTKLTIASLEKDFEDCIVAAQYNPKELQVDRNVPWSKPAAANKTNAKGKGSTTQTNSGKSAADGGIRMEFTGAEGRSLTVELLFDSYETGSGGPVLDMISKLETMATVKSTDPAAPEAMRRPHQCVVTWGQRGLPSFKCVIQSLSVKYQAFTKEGEPLRASATVKLAEADSVALGKAT